jgi:hypothetical protein
MDLNNTRHANVSCLQKALNQQRASITVADSVGDWQPVTVTRVRTPTVRCPQSRRGPQTQLN